MAGYSHGNSFAVRIRLNTDPNIFTLPLYILNNNMGTEALRLRP